MQANITSWKPLEVHRDLFAPTIPSTHSVGLSLPAVNGCCPFTLVPRQSTINSLPKKGMQNLFNSLDHILSCHRVSLARGHSKTIFGDEHTPVMYKCLGVRANRASTGVLDYDDWASKIDSLHWRRILRMVRRAELLFDSFASDEVLQHIRCAKHVVPFKTMCAPSSYCIPPAKYFGAIAFGCNVFLRCHTDDDFTLSMAHVLLDGHDQYQLDDDVIIFFCFPTLGVAVPMRPGDFLLFNSQLPHCISTRCRHSERIMCISMFLKTLVVGENNNSQPLTSTQHSMSELYRSKFKSSSNK
jgi:hypothetical protein